MILASMLDLWNLGQFRAKDQLGCSQRFANVDWSKKKNQIKLVGLIFTSACARKQINLKPLVCRQMTHAIDLLLISGQN